MEPGFNGFVELEGAANFRNESWMICDRSGGKCRGETI